MDVKKEILRKIFHIVSILALLIPLEIFGKYSISVLMGIMLIVFFPIAFFNIRNRITWIFWKVLELVERDFNWEKLPARQAFSLASGLLFSSLIFPEKVVEVAVVCVAVYDGFSTIFGITLGKHKINIFRFRLKKSYEGSFAGFFFNTIALIFLVPLYKAVILSIITGIIELFSSNKIWYLDDNFLIPVFVSIAAYFLGVY
jgi:dolichol kinase